MINKSSVLPHSIKKILFHFYFFLSLLLIIYYIYCSYSLFKITKSLMDFSALYYLKS